MKSSEADIHSSVYNRFARMATQHNNDYLISRIKEIKFQFHRNNMSILDIGPGTDNLMIALANDPFHADDHLVGVDFSEPMIWETRQNAIAARLKGQLHLELMDIHHLNIPDDLFDLIVGRSILRHFENPLRAFTEMRRVLHTEGMVLINEHRRRHLPKPWLGSMRRGRHWAASR